MKEASAAQMRDVELRAAIALRDTKEGEVIDFSTMLLPQAVSYGRPTPIQEGIIEQYVKGKEVHDIFAGALYLSHRMLEMGAKRVHAIDSQLAAKNNADLRIVQHAVTVEEFLKHRSGRRVTAFISWPDHFVTRGIGLLLARFSKVLYLGCNTGGTRCGSEALWQDLLTREVLEYAPDKKNTLIVYGKKRHFLIRPMMGEEFAAWETRSIVSFDQAEGAQCEVSTSRGRVKGVRPAKALSAER